jgi:DNA-binding NarL/FixJ family response regulator
MKILVVGDDVLIRQALRGVLKELKDDADVLEASDCRQAMALIAENADDLSLILLDVGLPDRDGFSALAEVRERYSAISIVVLSDQHDRVSVVKALDLGAQGFIPKTAQREVMVRALQLVFAGGIYIPEILTRDRPGTSPGSKRPVGERPPTSPADPGLAGRQHDYAKQKYYEALKYLIGSEPLDQRLHSAMFPLLLLSPNDLPEDMRADHEHLRYALAVREITWEVSEQNIPSADELAVKILSMYTRLMGGAPDTCPDYNPAGGPNDPPKLLPGWFAAMLDEEGPRN